MEKYNKTIAVILTVLILGFMSFKSTPTEVDTNTSNYKIERVTAYGKTFYVLVDHNGQPKAFIKY